MGKANRVLVNLLQTNGQRGGIEVYSKELYTELTKAGQEIDFFALVSFEMSNCDYSWFNGTIIRSRVRSKSLLQWALAELFVVPYIAKKQAIDLIHCPAMIAPIQKTIPVLLTIHDLNYFTHPKLTGSSLKALVVRWMERVAVRGASRIITISEATKSQILIHLPKAIAATTVIPLAARKSLINSDKALPTLRSEPFFLAMGQRSPYKDFLTILKAFSLTLEDDNFPKLVITGGTENDTLEKIVNNLGLGHRVTLKKRVPDAELQSLMTESLAIIDSTICTGFSLPAVEAMAQGVPVLLSDTAAFREIGKDAAKYFSTGNPLHLSQLLKAVVSRPEGLLHGSVRGVEIHGTRNWEDVANETLKIIRQVLSKTKVH